MGFRWIDRLRKSTVVVHVSSGASIRGVLVGTYSDCLVLAHAQFLGTDGSVRPIDGEAVIPREQVEWMQASMREAERS